MSERFARLISTGCVTPLRTDGDHFSAMRGAVGALAQDDIPQAFEVSLDVRIEMDEQFDRDVREGLVKVVLQPISLEPGSPDLTAPLTSFMDIPVWISEA